MNTEDAMENDDPLKGNRGQEMIEKFQCPGCVSGPGIDCGSFAVEMRGDGVRCSSHVLGTSIGRPGNLVALGMPKGFNKPRIKPDRLSLESRMQIWFYRKDAEVSECDWLNIPVWIRQEDGYLFVRVYSPRIDDSCIFVIEDGRPGDYPDAIDISGRLGEID